MSFDSLEDCFEPVTASSPNRIEEMGEDVDLLETFLALNVSQVKIIALNNPKLNHNL